MYVRRIFKFVLLYCKKSGTENSALMLNTIKTRQCVCNLFHDTNNASAKNTVFSVQNGV